jgi:hypothetical protein
MLETAEREGNLLPHIPIHEGDLGVPFVDEDRAAWQLFPMGPSSLDRVMLFDQDGS